MRKLSILFVLLCVLSMPAWGSERGILYQTSTIDALMAGQYDGVCSLAELRTHGDFGIGTFDRLNGEMLLLDGKFYRVSCDGKAAPVSKDTTPFAAVTFFRATSTACVGSEMDLKGLTQKIDSLLESKNLFCAIRIDATFEYVRTRSVPPQVKPYPRLTDVVAHQPTFEMHDVKGTIIGLYCPYFAQGVNVPGYHFHFISNARTQGGHVLDCRLNNGVITLDSTPQFTLVLPTQGQFLTANIQPKTGDVEKVEKGK